MLKSVLAVLIAAAPLAFADSGSTFQLYLDCGASNDCVEFPHLDQITKVRVEKSPAMTVAPQDVVEAFVRNGEFGDEVLNVQLSKEAGDKFADLTGRSNGRTLAIVFEGKVLTNPVIKDRINGGSFQISLGVGGPKRFWENVPWLRDRMKTQEQAEVRTANIHMFIFVVFGALCLVGALWFAFGRGRKNQASSM